MVYGVIGVLVMPNISSVVFSLFVVGVCLVGAIGLFVVLACGTHTSCLFCTGVHVCVWGWVDVGGVCVCACVLWHWWAIFT